MTADDDDWRLPIDRELMEFFQSADESVTWVEYFGFEDAPRHVERRLDARVREFFIERGL